MWGHVIFVQTSIQPVCMQVHGGDARQNKAPCSGLPKYISHANCWMLAKKQLSIFVTISEWECTSQLKQRMRYRGTLCSLGIQTRCRNLSGPIPLLLPNLSVASHQSPPTGYHLNSALHLWTIHLWTIHLFYLGVCAEKGRIPPHKVKREERERDGGSNCSKWLQWHDVNAFVKPELCANAPITTVEQIGKRMHALWTW